MKKVFYTTSLVALALMSSCGEETKETKETEAKAEVKDTAQVEVVEAPIEMPAGWEMTQNAEMTFLAVKDSVSQAEMPLMSAKMGADYGKIVKYMTKNKIEFAGAPLTQWYSWDTTAYSVFVAGIPVAPGTVGTKGIEVLTIPAGNVVKYTHTGSYESMQDAHFAINDYFMMSGTEAIGGPWEVYITDPGMEPDTTKWISEIYYPVAGE